MRCGRVSRTAKAATDAVTLPSHGMRAGFEVRRQCGQNADGDTARGGIAFAGVAWVRLALEALPGSP